MHYGGGAVAAGAAAAAIAQATKASGAIVKMTPENFMKIINKMDDGLVVVAEGGIFKKNYQYLTSYKGLFFFTKSPEPLSISSRIETVLSSKIWIPGQA
jgi:hypothetical protein